MVIVAPTLQRGTWIKVPDRSDGMCGQERESKTRDCWILGLTVVATVSTSPSAFQCLARSSNGITTWGYGIFFSRAFAKLSCQICTVIDQLICSCVTFLNMPLITSAAIERIQIRRPAKSRCPAEQLHRPSTAGAARRFRRHGTISKCVRPRIWCVSITAAWPEA